MIRKLIMYLGLILAPLLLASCSTVRPVGPKYVGPVSAVLPALPSQVFVPRRDVLHVVIPGETVFRLSKMYSVSVSDILAKNHLGASAGLKMGQTIIIPKAGPAKEVIPVFPSDKWKYIIVHHSATDEDNALSLFNMHLRRGFDGTGYDFLIDNGTKGTTMGHVDATPRWINQKDGAHCKASGMNKKAIGICLVGNFSKEKLPDQQLQSLVHLVNYLRKYYHIPLQNIMGHSQVPEASTECPGVYFPFENFKRMLADDKG
ncbi:MAG: N-acetylmuramoyl-L-alanine amidase [Candidatus Omnitrophota bacterium]